MFTILKINDKRDDFDFDITKFLFLDVDAPRRLFNQIVPVRYYVMVLCYLCCCQFR